MTILNLLTDNGFKSIHNINNLNVYNTDFKLKKNSYINRYENFYFPAYELKLATGLILTCRSTHRFKGLIFNVEEIKNDLDIQLVSQFNSGDYIYTPFNDKDLFNRTFMFTNIEINNSLSLDFYTSNENFKCKIKNRKSYFRDSFSVKINSSFYKFLAIALVRGSLNLEENYISFKFNKKNDMHLRMKSDLIDFFESSDLNYEITEYNKYFYLNYSDETLLALVENLAKERYNEVIEIFNNEFQELFLLYLYTITKNTYYLSYNTYLFFKTLAYNNNLILITEKNSINSNHNYSLKSRLDIDMLKENSFSVPETIYLEFGYLTKIISIKNITLKGDADLLPEYLLVC